MTPDHPRPDDADREAPELSGAGCWVALAALLVLAVLAPVVALLASAAWRWVAAQR